MVILATTVSEKIAHMFDFEFVPQTFVSLLIMLIVLVFAIIIGIKIKHAEITDKPKGLILLGMMFYQMMENFTLSIMGYKYRGFTRVMMVICP